MSYIYFAPLEGITGYIYRNAYNEIIKGRIDKYFSPFISPGVNQPLSRKELRDVMPENNRGVYLVPQLLGARAEDILLGMEAIKELGYREVNLNLGCPSGTVVAKKKGSGMLENMESLDEFLYKIFEKADVKISVKTRIGKTNPDDFYKILEIYNRYKMEELIIHPRIQTDFYRGKPRIEYFGYAVKNSENTLCYNGDIVSAETYGEYMGRYEDIPVERAMVGRGFIRNPLLIHELTENNKNQLTDDGKRKLLLEFHERLLEDYRKEMSGERPVLFKMKELWTYMGDNFADSEKELKKIRKSEKIEVYKAAAENIINTKEIKG